MKHLLQKDEQKINTVRHNGTLLAIMLCGILFLTTSNRVLLDDDGETAKKYRVVGIPISFIIDKQGIIVEKLVGEVDWKSSKIRPKINGLL